MWGISVRDQLGGSPEATRLDLLSREEKRENQAYWKAKIGYNVRWVAEGAISIFKRISGEHVMSLTVGEHHPRDTTQGGLVQQVEGRIDGP